MEFPLISVVIPTYSRPQNLTRAIDSVLAQTYTNYEIIVVDDNGKGTENQIYTAKLLEKYGDKVTYITYEANKGANYARNKGIKVAKGEYVSFLDDDDTYYNNNFHERIVLINHSSTEVKAIFCNQTINGNFYRWNEILYNSSDKYVKVEIEDLFQKGNCIGGFSVFMVKKEALLEVGLLNENLPSCQDWDLYIRLSSKGVLIWGINKQLVNYKFDIYDRQISTQASKVIGGISGLIQNNLSVISGLNPSIKSDFYQYLSRKCIYYSTKHALRYNKERLKGTDRCIVKFKIAFIDSLYLCLASIVLRTPIGKRIRNIRMKRNVAKLNCNITVE